MSSNRKPIIIDKTDQESSSGEAVIVIAVVLGFFFSILIGLCILRRRETIKRLWASKESTTGSYSIEQHSGTNSTSTQYLEASSATGESFELIRNSGITPLEKVEHVYEMKYPQSETNYYGYESSEKVPRRNSLEFEYYNVIQSDDSGSIIFPHEMIHYYELGSAYNTTTSNGSEATYSTSVEKIEDYEPLSIYVDHINREQYDSYNYFPEGRLAINHPEPVLQNLSHSLSEISFLDINVSNRSGQAKQDKWQFLNNDNTSGSTISTSNVEKTPPHHRNGSKGRGRSCIQSLYADSLTSLERNSAFGIQIPRTDCRGIVNVAVHPPFSDRTTSSTMVSEITDSQFARGRRRILYRPENGQQLPDNGPGVYEDQEAVMTVYCHERKDDRSPVLEDGENPRMLTSAEYTVHYGEHG